MGPDRVCSVLKEGCVPDYLLSCRGSRLTPGGEAVQ